MSTNENEKLRYSNADLAYFKDILNTKIEEAKEQQKALADTIGEYYWASTSDASRGIDTSRVNLNGDWRVGTENREPIDTSSMNHLHSSMRSTERDF